MKLLRALLVILLLPPPLIALDALSAAAHPHYGTYASELYETKGSLEEQNKIADRCGAERVRDDARLAELVAPEKVIAGLASGGWALARVPKTGRGYYLAGDEKYHYLDVRIIGFFEAFASEYFENFRSSLRVTSLLRTSAAQETLVKKGASGADGSELSMQSLHMAGLAIDISKQNLLPHQLLWIRHTLIHLKKDGVLDAIEEERHFHIVIVPCDPSKTVPGSVPAVTPYGGF